MSYCPSIIYLTLSIYISFHLYFIQQGKDPDKKRKTKRKAKMSHINNGSAIEAIEKIVQGRSYLNAYFSI